MSYTSKVQKNLNEMPKGVTVFIIKASYPPRFVYLNNRPLDSSQYASDRPCDLPNRPRFSVVLLIFAANTELVHRIHLALHFCHVTLPSITFLNFSLSQSCHTQTNSYNCTQFRYLPKRIGHAVTSQQFVPC
jgi:hypothetical protein